jgi:hypothetical protein
LAGRGILAENSAMTKILCFFFGLVSVGISASGQQSPNLSLKGFLPLPDTLQVLSMASPEQIRNMKPDRMPCLVPDLARLERMPVRRSSNADPMPNGFPSGGTWLLDFRAAGK